MCVQSVNDFWKFKSKQQQKKIIENATNNKKRCTYDFGALHVRYKPSHGMPNQQPAVLVNVTVSSVELEQFVIWLLRFSYHQLNYH